MERLDRIASVLGLGSIKLMSGSEVFLERSSSTKKVLSRKPSFVISNKVKTFKK